MSLKKNIISAQSGGVLILIAAALPLLLIIMGVALETGQVYAVRAKAQHAADSALLGAVATRSSITIQDEARRLFHASYPTGYFGANVADSDIVVNGVDGPTDDPGTTKWTETITIKLPNLVPKIVGQPIQNLTIISQAVKGSTCQQGFTCKKLELALVLDNTASMSNSIDGSSTSKLDALKQASSTLVNILFGDAETLNNLHISVVPYDIVVQIGTGHAAWIQQSNPVPNGWADWPTKTKHSSRDKYNNIVTTYKKGFAANRQTDNQCGWYYYTSQNSGNTCPGQQSCSLANCGATCNLNTKHCAKPDPCDTFTPNCSITHNACTAKTAAIDCPPVIAYDSEGVPHNNNQSCTTSCTRCTGDGTQTCTPKCTPSGPSTSYHWAYGASGGVACANNSFNDIDDTAPSGDNTLFRLPYENYYPEPVMPNSDVDVNTGKPFSGNVGVPGTNYAHLWPTNLAPMLFASNSKSEILNALNQMKTSGDTRINVGLMWGWFTLSPKWQGLWDASKPTFPLTPDQYTLKQVVLMTDGLNDLGAGDDTKTSALCTAMKKQGITIYTIGLGPPGGYNQVLLQGCASQPSFFFAAPSASQLSVVFKQIGDNILSVTEHLTQ